MYYATMIKRVRPETKTLLKLGKPSVPQFLNVSTVYEKMHIKQ